MPTPLLFINLFFLIYASFETTNIKLDRQVGYLHFTDVRLREVSDLSKTVQPFIRKCNENTDL